MRGIHGLLIFSVALLGSVVGLVCILPLGLVVSELVVYPLALGIAALFAGLAAVWTQRGLASDGLHSRLWPVLGLAEASAATMVALVFAAFALQMAAGRPLLGTAIVCGILLAMSATFAVYVCRGPNETQQDDKRITIGLLVLAVLSVPAVVFAASLIGLAGA